MILALLAGGALTAAPLPPLPACTLHRAGAPPAAGVATGDGIAAAWPDAWRRRGTLADAGLAPGDLDRAVAALACLASWPGEAERATALALPLFGSRRHGMAAFLAIDGLARSPAVSPARRAAAAQFRATMRDAVARAYDRI